MWHVFLSIYLKHIPGSLIFHIRFRKHVKKQIHPILGKKKKEYRSDGMR